MASGTLSKQWKTSLKNRTFRRHFAFSVGVLALALPLYPTFLKWVESRHGVALPDPLLPLLPRVDLSGPIFTLIMAGLFGGIAALISDPPALTLALQSYGWMILIRMLMMALLPLAPPPDMLPLRDPFVELFGTHGATLTHDLFFSGHTATLTLIALRQRRPVMRWVFGLSAVVVAPLLLVQRAHYSIDVVAAPFFAYCACRLADRLSAKRSG